MTSKCAVLPQSSYFTLQELADGVYAAISKPGTGSWSNAGIIDLGEETLIFDTLNTPQAARDLRMAAEQVTGRSPKYVVNSHRHIDHVFGNQVFRDATIISTDEVYAALQEVKSSWSNLEEMTAEFAEHIKRLTEDQNRQTNPRIIEGFRYEIMEFEVLRDAFPEIIVTLPTVTFSERMQIRGSKRSVELYSYGGGHSQSDAFLYLPEEQIALMGDLVFVDTHPSYHGVPPEDWIDILKRVQILPIQQVVPGHGEVGGTVELEKMIGYQEMLLQNVSTATRQGTPVSQLLAEGIPAEYAEWAFAHVYAWNVERLYQRMTEAVQE